jgi:hypothetical protein
MWAPSSCASTAKILEKSIDIIVIDIYDCCCGGLYYYYYYYYTPDVGAILMRVKGKNSELYSIR